VTSLAPLAEPAPKQGGEEGHQAASKQVTEAEGAAQQKAERHCNGGRDGGL
jgi:hypothetical protein